MPIFAFGGSSGLTTTDANSLIDTAILANNATRAQTLRCRLRATSLAAFTASGSGVGKTLTKSSNGALGTVDSVTVVAGDRLFVDLGTANSGVYTATSVGAAGSPWVLTRTTDFDDANDVKSGTIVYVTEGTLYADTSWKLTTNDTITIDSTSQTWAAFTPNAYTDVTVGSLAISGTGGAVILTSTGSVIADDELYGQHLAVASTSPTQLTSNTDDLAGGDYGIIRISSDANRNLTGIVRPSGTYKDGYCKLVNVGSYVITLVNDATSTAQNRFLTGSGQDFKLAAGQSVDMFYDLTSSRWRLVGPHVKKSAIAIVIDGGGSAIATGIYADLPIPRDFYVTAAKMYADQSGSIVVDIWSDTDANYPATDADSITASAPPTISSATKSSDSTLTGWTKLIPAGNVLRFNVDSCTSITRATLILEGVEL